MNQVQRVICRRVGDSEVLLVLSLVLYSFCTGNLFPTKIILHITAASCAKKVYEIKVSDECTITNFIFYSQKL